MSAGIEVRGGAATELRRRAARALTAAVGIVTLAAAAPAEAQFSVQPAIMQFAPTDSADVSVIQVTNQGERDLQVRVYVSDFDQQGDGDFEFFKPGEGPGSCAARLQVFPDGGVIPAGGREEFRVRMEPGAETCWSLVFVENVAAAAGGVQVAQRIGVRVYGVAPGAALDGEVRTVSVAPVPPVTAADSAARAAGAKAPLAATIDFANLGQVPLRAMGELEIRRVTGEVVTQQAVEAFSVLPGRSRKVLVILDAELAPGRYLAVPVLDFGGEYLAGGQVAFEVR